MPPTPVNVPPSTASRAAPGAPESIGRERLWIPAGLVAVAVLLRVMMLWSFPPDGMTGDEYDYQELAEHYVRTCEFDSVTRAPGYVWFLGAVWQWDDDPVRGAQYAQIALAAITVALIYLIGRSELGPRAAAVGAGLFAIDPTMIAFSHYLFNETLFVVLLLGAAWFWLRAWRTGALWPLAPAGLLFGAATLTKSGALPILGALVLAMLWPRRWGADLASAESTSATAADQRGAKPAGGESRDILSRWPFGALARVSILLATWAAVVSPWSIHLSRRHDMFILVDLSAARTMWHSNRMTPIAGYDWGIGDRKRIRDAERRWRVPHPSLPRETAQSARALLERERAFIQSNPGHVLYGMPAKMAALWNPTNYMQRRIARGQMLDARGHEPIPLERESAWGLALGLSSTFVYVAAMGAGALGLWHARRSGLLWFSMAAIGSQTLVCGALLGLSRYRMPLMPFVFLFAGAAVCAASRHVARPSWRSWRTWAAGVTMALLAVSWWPYRDYALMRVNEDPRFRSNAAKQDAARKAADGAPRSGTPRRP